MSKPSIFEYEKNLLQLEISNGMSGENFEALRNWNYNALVLGYGDWDDLSILKDVSSRVLSFKALGAEIIDLKSLEFLTHIECLMLWNVGTPKKGESLDFTCFRKMEKCEINWTSTLYGDSIFQCENLEKLKIQLWKDKEFTKLGNLKNLVELDILQSQLQSVEGIDRLTKLKILSFSLVQKLEKIDGLEVVESLKELSFFSCRNVDSFAVLEGLTALKKLKIKKVSFVSSWSFLFGMKGLDFIELDQLPNDEELVSIFALPNLEEIIVTDLNKKLFAKYDFSSLKNKTVRNVEILVIHAGAGMSLYINFDDPASNGRRTKLMEIVDDVGEIKVVYHSKFQN